MVIGECLEQATTFDGRRRFYAPGQHPATYRDRYMVETMLHLFRIPHPGDETLGESIAWHQKRVDDFERGQCLEKARYIESTVEGLDPNVRRVVRRLREEAEGATFPS